MRLHNPVTIERAPEEVFSFLADFENIPAWNNAILRTRKITNGPVGAGTKYRQLRRLPRLAEEGFEIVQFEPNVRLSIAGRFEPFRGQLTYLLEPVGRGTRVIVTAQPSGIRRLVGSLAASKLRSAVRDNLEDLKRILEYQAEMVMSTKD